MTTTKVSVFVVKRWSNVVTFAEMIRNYLSTARVRFLQTQHDKKDDKKTNGTLSSTSSSSSSSSSSTVGTDNYAAPCVNSGCKNYGTAATSYLCTSCHAEQQEAISKENMKNEMTSQKEKVSDIAKNIDDSRPDGKVTFDEFGGKCAAAASDLIAESNNSGVCVTFN